MKLNIFTAFFFFCFLFFGSHLKAQDSQEIINLKKNLANVKDEKAAIEIVRDIANSYSQSAKPDSAIVYGKRLLKYFTKIDEKDKIGRVNMFLGNLYANSNRYEQAEASYAEAEKHLENIKDIDQKAALRLALGGIYSYKKNYEKAEPYYLKNIQDYKDGKKIGIESVITNYRYLFGNYFAQQNLGEAFKYLNEYVDLVKKNSPEKLSEAYNVQAGFYTSTNDYQRALEIYQKLHPIYIKQKDAAQIAMNKRNIGGAYYGLQKMDSAKLFLNDALDYYQAKNDQKSKADIYNILSHIAQKNKQFEEAEKLIANAVAITSKESQSYFYHQSQLSSIKVFNMAKDSVAIRNNPEKITELKKIIATTKEELEKINAQKWFVDSDLNITNYTTLSNAYELIGDYKNAHLYFQKAMKEKENSYGIEKMKELSNVQTNTELLTQKNKIQLEEETRRINLQKEIELKALRFEYEKKQALAKTQEEKERLILEEDLKRKEIQIKYEQEQNAVKLKYEQEAKLAKLEQEKTSAISKAELESSKRLKNMWAVGAGLSLLLLGFAGFSYNQKRKDNKKIAIEKQKSDDLLLNILPYEVAEELKATGETSAKHYDEVSVLFTDFVNFTTNSEKIGVQEVIAELNVCFTEFDRIMDKYHLEKIKTIGDAYLAVSGLPVSNEQHAKNAINAGLEILTFVEERKLNNPNALDIRIGIHSGPVIAGIVGVKKFAYDIWGDTVNTAARMEQNSIPGKINVSESTYHFVKSDFSFESRGKIETKGKGAMDMYFASKI